MLECAIANHPSFRIDRRELEREGPCYTIDTLSALRDELPRDTALVWLIGADSLLTLDRWRDWRALLDLATLTVAVRPGFDLDTGLAAASPALAAAVRPRLRTANPSTFQTLSDRIAPERGTIVALTTTPLAISATAIRTMLRQGRPARYLAPDAVLDYAERHLLYQTPESHS
jgi:nicotinate-nucleotide adenylyltransferase